LRRSLIVQISALFEAYKREEEAFSQARQREIAILLDRLDGVGAENDARELRSEFEELQRQFGGGGAAVIDLALNDANNDGVIDAKDSKPPPPVRRDRPRPARGRESAEAPPVLAPQAAPAPPVSALQERATALALAATRGGSSSLRERYSDRPALARPALVRIFDLEAQKAERAYAIAAAAGSGVSASALRGSVPKELGAVQYKPKRAPSNVGAPSGLAARTLHENSVRLQLETFSPLLSNQDVAFEHGDEYGYTDTFVFSGAVESRSADDFESEREYQHAFTLAPHRFEVAQTLGPVTSGLSDEVAYVSAIFTGTSALRTGTSSGEESTPRAWRAAQPFVTSDSLMLPSAMRALDLTQNEQRSGASQPQLQVPLSRYAYERAEARDGGIDSALSDVSAYALHEARQSYALTRATLTQFASLDRASTSPTTNTLFAPELIAPAARRVQLAVASANEESANEESAARSLEAYAELEQLLAERVGSRESFDYGVLRTQTVDEQRYGPFYVVSGLATYALSTRWRTELADEFGVEPEDLSRALEMRLQRSSERALSKVPPATDRFKRLFDEVVESELRQADREDALAVDEDVLDAPPRTKSRKRRAAIDTDAESGTNAVLRDMAREDAEANGKRRKRRLVQVARGVLSDSRAFSMHSAVVARAATRRVRSAAPGDGSDDVSDASGSDEGSGEEIADDDEFDDDFDDAVDTYALNRDSPAFVAASQRTGYFGASVGVPSNVSQESLLERIEADGGVWRRSAREIAQLAIFFKLVPELYTDRFPARAVDWLLGVVRLFRQRVDAAQQLYFYSVRRAARSLRDASNERERAEAEARMQTSALPPVLVVDFDDDVLRASSADNEFERSVAQLIYATHDKAASTADVLEYGEYPKRNEELVALSYPARDTYAKNLATTTAYLTTVSAFDDAAAAWRRQAPSGAPPMVAGEARWFESTLAQNPASSFPALARALQPLFAANDLNPIDRCVLPLPQTTGFAGKGGGDELLLAALRASENFYAQMHDANGALNTDDLRRLARERALDRTRASARAELQPLQRAAALQHALDSFPMRDGAELRLDSGQSTDAVAVYDRGDGDDAPNELNVADSAQLLLSARWLGGGRAAVLEQRNASAVTELGAVSVLQVLSPLVLQKFLQAAQKELPASVDGLSDKERARVRTALKRGAQLVAEARRRESLLGTPLESVALVARVRDLVAKVLADNKVRTSAEPLRVGEREAVTSVASQASALLGRATLLTVERAAQATRVVEPFRAPTDNAHGALWALLAQALGFFERGLYNERFDTLAAFALRAASDEPLVARLYATPRFTYEQCVRALRSGADGESAVDAARDASELESLRNAIERETKERSLGHSLWFDLAMVHNDPSAFGNRVAEAYDELLSALLGGRPLIGNDLEPYLVDVRFDTESTSDAPVIVGAPGTVPANAVSLAPNVANLVRLSARAASNVAPRFGAPPGTSEARQSELLEQVVPQPLGSHKKFTDATLELAQQLWRDAYAAASDDQFSIFARRTFTRRGDELNLYDRLRSFLRKALDDGLGAADARSFFDGSAPVNVPSELLEDARRLREALRFDEREERDRDAQVGASALAELATAYRKIATSDALSESLRDVVRNAQSRAARDDALRLALNETEQAEYRAAANRDAIFDLFARERSRIIDDIRSAPIAQLRDNVERRLAQSEVRQDVRIATRATALGREFADQASRAQSTSAAYASADEQLSTFAAFVDAYEDELGKERLSTIERSFVDALQAGYDDAVQIVRREALETALLAALAESERAQQLTSDNLEFVRRQARAYVAGAELFDSADAADALAKTLLGERSFAQAEEAKARSNTLRGLVEAYVALRKRVGESSSALADDDDASDEGLEVESDDGELSGFIEEDTNDERAAAGDDTQADAALAYSERPRSSNYAGMLTYLGKLYRKRVRALRLQEAIERDSRIEEVRVGERVVSVPTAIARLLAPAAFEKARAELRDEATRRAAQYKLAPRGDVPRALRIEEIVAEYALNGRLPMPSNAEDPIDDYARLITGALAKNLSVGERVDLARMRTLPYARAQWNELGGALQKQRLAVVGGLHRREPSGADTILAALWTQLLENYVRVQRVALNALGAAGQSVLVRFKSLTSFYLNRAPRGMRAVTRAIAQLPDAGQRLALHISLFYALHATDLVRELPFASQSLPADLLDVGVSAPLLEEMRAIDARLLCAVLLGFDYSQLRRRAANSAVDIELRSVDGRATLDVDGDRNADVALSAGNYARDGSLATQTIDPDYIWRRALTAKEVLVDAYYRAVIEAVYADRPAQASSSDRVYLVSASPSAADTVELERVYDQFLRSAVLRAGSDDSRYGEQVALFKTRFVLDREDRLRSLMISSRERGAVDINYVDERAVEAFKNLRRRRQPTDRSDMLAMYESDVLDARLNVRTRAYNDEQRLRIRDAKLAPSGDLHRLKLGEQVQSLVGGNDFELVKRTLFSLVVRRRTLAQYRSDGSVPTRGTLLSQNLIFEPFWHYVPRAALVGALFALAKRVNTPAMQQIASAAVKNISLRLENQLHLWQTDERRESTDQLLARKPAASRGEGAVIDLTALEDDAKPGRQPTDMNVDEDDPDVQRAAGAEGTPALDAQNSVEREAAELRSAIGAQSSASSSAVGARGIDSDNLARAAQQFNTDDAAFQSYIELRMAEILDARNVTLAGNMRAPPTTNLLEYESAQVFDDKAALQRLLRAQVLPVLDALDQLFAPDGALDSAAPQNVENLLIEQKQTLARTAQLPASASSALLYVLARTEAIRRRVWRELALITGSNDAPPSKEELARYQERAQTEKVGADGAQVTFFALFYDALERTLARNSQQLSSAAIIDAQIARDRQRKKAGAAEFFRARNGKKPIPASAIERYVSVQTALRKLLVAQTDSSIATLRTNIQMHPLAPLLAAVVNETPVLRIQTAPRNIKSNTTVESKVSRLDFYPGGRNFTADEVAVAANTTRIDASSALILHEFAPGAGKSSTKRYTVVNRVISVQRNRAQSNVADIVQLAQGGNGALPPTHLLWHTSS